MSELVKYLYSDVIYFIWSEFAVVIHTHTVTHATAILQVNPITLLILIFPFVPNMCILSALVKKGKDVDCISIKSNQIKIYIAPYVHEESEALGRWITCIARLMYKTHLTRISSLKLSRQAVI